MILSTCTAINKYFLAMKPNSITYDVFLSAIEQLETLGEKITVRSIIDKIGGSFTKIAEFKRQWQQNQALAKEATLKMSSHLETAIYAEFSRLHTSAQTAYKQQIEQAEKDHQELLAVTKNLEDENAYLKENISTIQKNQLAFLMTYTRINEEKSALLLQKAELEEAIKEGYTENLKTSDHNKQLKDEILNLQGRLERQTNRCLQIESLYQKMALELSSLKTKFTCLERKTSTARFSKNKKESLG